MEEWNKVFEDKYYTRKRCITCKQWKDRSEYYDHPKNPDKKFYECKPCHTARMAITNRMSMYGLSKEQFDAMRAERDDLCDICKQLETTVHGFRLQDPGKPNTLSVDHNHVTERVRGLLCKDCNTKLGILEDKEWTRKAYEYLEMWDRIHAEEDRLRAERNGNGYHKTETVQPDLFPNGEQDQ